MAHTDEVSIFKTANGTDVNQQLKTHCINGSAIAAISQVRDSVSACAAESLLSHSIYTDATYHPIKSSLCLLTLAGLIQISAQQPSAGMSTGCTHGTAVNCDWLAATLEDVATVEDTETQELAELPMKAAMSETHKDHVCPGLLAAYHLYLWLLLHTS